MTHKHPTIRSFDLDPLGRLAIDVACISCGYNLKSIERHGLCPECGTTVERSLQGDRLQYSPREWVSTVFRGLKLTVTSFQILVVLTVLSVVFISFLNTGPPTPFNPLFISVPLIAVFVIAGLATLLGLWLYAAPEPRPSKLPTTARFDARILVKLFLVTFGLSLSVRVLFDEQLSTFILGFVIISSAHGLLISTAKHTEQLFKRVPDDKTARSARMAYQISLLVLLFTLVGFVLPLLKKRWGLGLLGCGNLLTILAALYLLRTLSYARKTLNVILWLAPEGTETEVR